MAKSKEYIRLEKEYKKLARRADDRLRALEATSRTRGFYGAKRYAYARAGKDVQKWGGNINRPRFNTKAPESTSQLKAKIADIQQFLSSETSTKRGIINTYKKRADTINKEYGTSFTWQELANYYESGASELYSNMFGSKTALYTIAEMQKSKKQLVKAIKKANEQNIKVDVGELTGNRLVDAKVNKLLDEQGLSIIDLI